MALHQRVEKMPERRERLVFGGRGPFELAEIFAGQARRDVAELQLAIAAPGEKAADDPAVSAPGVFVADAGLEEFVGGEGGVRGPLQDARSPRPAWERTAADARLCTS